MSNALAYIDGGGFFELRIHRSPEDSNYLATIVKADGTYSGFDDNALGALLKAIQREQRTSGHTITETHEVTDGKT
jgi:hypothetical protein